MKNNDGFNLKLLAKNQDDLKVISAHLQDSVVTVKDIIFLKKNRTFIMIVNRFMWEDVEKGVFRNSKRIRCAIKFEEVVKAESKNINQKNRNKPLECLAIKSLITEDESHKIKIFFAGDSIITIVVEVINVILQDLGKSWKAKHIPKHKI